MVGTAEPDHEITGGVDTHADTHTAAALDELGRFLGHDTFQATVAGYAELLAWLAGFGPIVAVGVEGTGSYGAGPARYLTRNEVRIIEVDRPGRRARRRNGKSDPADAVAAARAVQAGTATGTPKSRTGWWSPSGRFEWPGTVRSSPTQPRSMRYSRWLSPHPTSAATNSPAWARRPWSKRVPECARRLVRSCPGREGSAASTGTTLSDVG
jgi:hypothetical protein